MGRADDEVDQVGILRGQRGQRADHGLDALAGAQQAEGQQHPLTRDAEHRLERLRVARIHLRNAVRDDVHVAPAHAVGAGQELLGDLAHDHERRALPGHLLHDRALRFGRLAEHGVQGGHGRNSQRGQEVEDVDAVVAAEDPVLVLDRDQSHVAVVDELGRAGVVALHPLADLVPDIVRIVVLAARIGDGQAHGQDSLTRRHRARQIARERGDAAAPGRIRAHKGHPHAGAAGDESKW